MTPVNPIYRQMRLKYFSVFFFFFTTLSAPKHSLQFITVLQNVFVTEGMKTQMNEGMSPIIGSISRGKNNRCLKMT
jgi:hypothetical protein